MHVLGSDNPTDKQMFNLHLKIVIFNLLIVCIGPFVTTTRTVNENLPAKQLLPVSSAEKIY